MCRLCLNFRNDYYLRPNGCIAIALAPELFSADKANKYLSTVEKLLIVRKIKITLIPLERKFFGSKNSGPQGKNLCSLVRQFE
mgnify:CR=1 FL=1